jgi:hypothetical protein
MIYTLTSSVRLIRHWFRPRAYLLLLLAFCFTVPLSAQTDMMDTLKEAFQHKPKPLVYVAGRNSFVQNNRADIWGFGLGISYNKRVRIGAGYNFMSSNLTQPLGYNDPGGVPKNVLMHMKLRYISAYFEYVYYRNKQWVFSIPVQLGCGSSKYIYSINTIHYSRDQQLIVLYEPMIRTQYYIFNWLGAEVDVGLRLMLKNNRAIGRNFNSPMYSFGVFIAWDELFKSLFPNTALAKKM